jgi:hypothetical protein
MLVIPVILKVDKYVLPYNSVFPVLDFSKLFPSNCRLDSPLIVFPVPVEVNI